jgi:hypothetical protein
MLPDPAGIAKQDVVPGDCYLYIVVPKADDLAAFRFQIRSSFFIVLSLIQVLTPVEFDDEFLSWSAEVHDVFTDSVLVPKMDALQLVRAQPRP